MHSHHFDSLTGCCISPFAMGHDGNLFPSILFSEAFPTLLFAGSQEAFQIGIYWAHTNTVHKSTAFKLVHDVTTPRWKDGSGSEMVTLDEEGCVEVDITLGAFPGRQKVRVAAVGRLSDDAQGERKGVFWSSTRKPLAQGSKFIPRGRSK